MPQVVLLDTRPLIKPGKGPEASRVTSDAAQGVRITEQKKREEPNSTRERHFSSFFSCELVKIRPASAQRCRVRRFRSVAFLRGTLGPGRRNKHPMEALGERQPAGLELPTFQSRNVGRPE